MLQIRRGEASQAQDCFARMREVLTAWLGVDFKVMERRGLKRGSWQGWVRGCLQQ